MEELTSKQIQRLKEKYEELKVIANSVNDSVEQSIHQEIVLLYNKLVEDLWEILNSKSEIDILRFKVNPKQVPYKVGRKTQQIRIKKIYEKAPFISLINRLIVTLKSKYKLEEHNEKINLETKKIIDTIKDDELKKRCFRLLSEKVENDTILREATTILEDRIKKLSRSNLTHVGVKLVDKVLSPTTGLLKLDAEKNEQHGYYQLFRGVMLSFRDEHHHKITDDFAEDDTIKILALIDILLDVLSKYKPK